MCQRLYLTPFSGLHQVIGCNPTATGADHVFQLKVTVRILQTDTAGGAECYLWQRRANSLQFGRTAEDVQARATSLARNRSGCIRISVADSTILHWVIPVTCAYRKTNPDVQFEFDHTGLQVDLAKGEADIAFRVADEVIGDTLVVHKLGMATWAVYCSKPYIRKFGLPRSFEELEGRKVLFYTKNMTARGSSLRYFADRIRPEQVSETYNSIASIAGPQKLSSLWMIQNTDRLPMA